MSTTEVTAPLDAPSPPSPPSSSTNSPPPPSPSTSPPPPPTEEPPPQASPPPPSPPSSDKQPPSDKQSPPPPPLNDNNDRSHNSENSVSPPPPPSKALTPPDAKSTGSNVDHSSHNQKVLLAGAAAALLLLILLFLVACCRRRKRKHQELKYYRDNFSPNQGNDYYNSGGWKNNVQSNEHAMKMPPSNQVSSEYGWGMQPPPPPMMSSGEQGSTNFSGQHYSLPPHPSKTLGFNQNSFSYEDLAAATGGFAKSNLLGQGGFGYVHKGVLPNGKEVAVKSLKANSGQGEREFQAEVDIISRVHHRHLVSLVGYCITGSQRMLVYEFVSNNTLEYHLHGTGRPVMDWPTRLKIALGSAKGFAYLHEDCHPRIIHRDIKVANILLDDNYDAQVADFGLAKLSNDTNTHVSTRIMGTFGYLAPEYAASGKLTEKSDVYSYGIVLLELITGKRPIDIHSDDEDTLVEWARPILSRILNDGGSYEEIADPRLKGNYDPQEMLAMLACADACTRHSGRRRPKMSQVVRALEGDMSIDALNEGIRRGSSSGFGSQSDLKRLAKSAGLSSQDFTSSEKWDD